MFWTQWLFLPLLHSVNGLGLDTIGLLQPADETAVDISVPNLGEYADYTFRYITTNAIPNAGLITVTFPQQYQIGLGVAGNPKCVGGTCQLSLLTVTITLPSGCAAGQTCTFTINQIKNPTHMGGTGPFSLTSYKGVNAIDTNEVFGVVGIDAPVGQLTTGSFRIMAGASNYAGETSIYDVYLRSVMPLYVGCWIRITIPFDSFSFPAVPYSQLISLDGRYLPGIIYSAFSNNQITISGISTEVPGGTDIGVRITGTNPLKQGVTGSFMIETGRGGTKVVYARIAGLSGVTISPGKITGISMTSVDPIILLATSKVIMYTLKFTMSNPIQSGGKILITCNSLFNMDGLYNNWVNYGLTDISVSQQVTLSYSIPTKVLTISGFSSYTTSEVSLNLELRNPVPSGKTPPLIIQSYRPDGMTLIDEDKVSAFVMVSTTSAPGITVSYLGTTQATGINIQLQFNFVPQVNIPALGFIKFRLPAGFTVPASPLTCIMKPLNVAVDVPAQCTFLSGIISIQLFASTILIPAGPGDFLLGATSYIQITNGLNAPTKAGPYVFDVSTHDTTGVLLESGTVNIDITGQSFSTVAITSLHSLVSTPTVLKFAFVPLLAVPLSQSQTVSLTTQGAIEFQLETMSAGNNLQFDLDLGLGLSQGDTLPCYPEQGVIGTINGSDVKCVLSTKPGNPSSISYVIITMTDFQAIAVGTQVVISLPGIYMSQTAGVKPKVRVTTYSVTNRVRLDLNTSIMLLMPSPAAAISGASVSVPSTIPNAFSSSSLLISDVTTLQGVIVLNTGVSAINTVLMMQFTPTHGTGYCLNAPQTTPFQCLIDLVVYPCTCYPSADILAVNMGTTPLSATTHSFKLKNIRNPDTVPAAQDELKVYTVDAGNVIDIVSYVDMLPAQTPGAFFSATITPSVTNLGAVHVIYGVKIQSTRIIPQNGSIVITFPGNLVFQNSTPVPYCSVPQLTAIDSYGVSCVAYSNTVTVSNFAAVQGGTYLEWVVTGVQHPSSGGQSGPFTLESRSQYGLTIDSQTYIGFAYTSMFVAGTMSVSYIVAIPSNAGAMAEYVFQLVPTNLIGKGGSISISFPSAQFPVLPNPPLCRVRGAMNSIASCVTSGTVVTVTLDQDCPITTLLIYIFNVRNPPTPGLTDLFSIISKYDGVTLDVSGVSMTSSVPAQALIKPKAPVLMVNSLAFTPRNEGEKATYTITVTPTVNIEPPNYLTITFPASYDKRLGDVLRCWTTSGFNGNLVCVVTAANQLQVQGNDAFTACSKCSVSISIYGVWNPRKLTTSNTGTFQVGVLAAMEYLEFTDQAAALDLLDAPWDNNINNLTLDNFDVRAPNLMRFNMTTTSSVPMTKYQGAIWIVFPDDYMWDGTVPQCTSSSFWAGGAPQCSLYFDTIKIWGSLVEFVGTLIVSILNVPNPQWEMKARSIVVKVYDGFNSKILDSSYVNLNPTSYKYTYPGPLITINKDSVITVQRGTATDLIAVALAYPCALNLTITPALEGFTITPPSIDLTVGQTYASFRVSTPAATPTKNFTMIWTTTGEVVPRYYTPLAKIVVSVVSSQVYKMTVDQPDPVPIGGTSVPVRTMITNPPDLDVTLEMVLDETLLGVSLDPDQLHFRPGDSQLYFRISVSSSLKPGSGTIALKLSGSNSPLYSLSTTSLSFAMILDTAITPLVSSIATTYVGKARADITVSGTTMGTAYFMCALAGSDIPSFDEVKTSGPAPFLSTRSLYGHTHLHSNKTGISSISDLIAARHYTIYAYLQDLLGRISIVTTTTFQMRPLAVPVSTAIRINQTSLNDVEVGLALSTIGLVLSLEDYRLPMLSVYSSPTLANTTTLQFAIVDSPFSDKYPTPMKLLDHIDKNRTIFKKRIANFDDQFDIIGLPATTGNCLFATPPVIGAFVSDTAISVSAMLQKDGEISAIAITNATSAAPYSWQAEVSLSPGNLPTSGFVRSVSGKTVLNETIPNLLPETGYNIYITCGNSNPTFAELQTSANMTVLAQMTEPTPGVKKLNINEGVWRKAVGVAILVLLM